MFPGGQTDLARMLAGAEKTRWPAVAKQGEELDETAPWDVTVAVCKMVTCTAHDLLPDSVGSSRALRAVVP